MNKEINKWRGNCIKLKTNNLSERPSGEVELTIQKQGRVLMLNHHSHMVMFHINLPNKGRNGELLLTTQRLLSFQFLTHHSQREMFLTN